jgi:hypothetical protein
MGAPVPLRHRGAAASGSATGGGGRLEREALPLLWEQLSRRKGASERSQGASVVRSAHGKTAAGGVQDIALRWLVVASTPRAKAKAPRLAVAHRAERAHLATRHGQALRRGYVRRTAPRRSPHDPSPDGEMAASA